MSHIYKGATLLTDRHYSLYARVQRIPSFHGCGPGAQALQVPTPFEGRSLLWLYLREHYFYTPLLIGGEGPSLGGGGKARRRRVYLRLLEDTIGHF